MTKDNQPRRFSSVLKFYQSQYWCFYSSFFFLLQFEILCLVVVRLNMLNKSKRNRKSDTVELPVSNHQKFQVEVVAYESLDHNGSIVSSLEYDNCRTHAPILMQCIIHVKVNFEKKPDCSLWEISVSCTSQKYDNVTTPYYPFFAPLFVNWSLTGG